ncbi:hypothetical protein WDZ17_13475 [Pseudokineococcus basanitobsidens]|uniref:O-antigen ligase-like membrane protein n=1 Tax=Pseudokineococcus basanitobsidens TaxID=1926649 RepID=A0ABU8RMQ4_9ACTN
MREGWPLALLVAGFPVWWALGLTDIAFALTAVPLAVTLVRRRRFGVPPGFGLWVLFLVWVLVSGVALDVTAPGTIPPSGTGRYIAYAARLADYLAVTVFLLYVGNTPESLLPRRRVVRWISLLAVWLVVLGLLSLALPTAAVPTPLGALLPGGSSTASLAQVQEVLGYEAPRPAAPFTYTNIWGNVLSIALVWVVVGWGVWGRARTRVLATSLALVALVPLVYSLNRAVWVGVALSVAYVAVRLALRGKVLLVSVAAVVAVVGTVSLAASPLGDVVDQRAEAGHSDTVREILAEGALRAAADSPVVGYGSTRAMPGSGSSIAVGPSPECPQCGARNIGSTGQLWLLLIAQGFVGTAVYFAFFAKVAWASRRDTTAVGLAGTLTVLLSVYYSAFYVAMTMPLALTMLAVALLWRNRQDAEYRRPPARASAALIGSSRAAP